MSSQEKIEKLEQELEHQKEVCSFWFERIETLEKKVAELEKKFSEK